MIKIRDIEQAVSNLPDKDFTRFRKWFHKYDAVRWDQQLKEDVRKGKLDKLAEKALKDLRNGKCKEI